MTPHLKFLFFMFFLIPLVTSRGAYAAGFINGDTLKDWANAHESVVATDLRSTDYVTNQILEAMQFLGYVAAVVETASHRVLPETVIYFCVPDGASLNQVASVASKYILDHPEDWHKEAPEIVVDALFEAFPCPGTLPLLRK